MINKRKIMMTLGMITATVVPLAVVVSCSCSSQSKTTEKINKPTAPEPGVTTSSKEGGNKVIAEKEMPIVKITLEEANTRLNGLTTIPAGMFANTELPAGFQVPREITKIENGAFKNAIAPNVFTIPRHGVDMDIPKAFEGIKPVENAFWRRPSRNEPIILDINQLSEGDRVWAVDEAHPSPFITQKEIDEFFYYSPKEIPDYKFRDKILPPNFKIPNGVEVIGRSAFVNAVFQSDFVLPTSVTKISMLAFSSAKFKGKFVVPETVTSMEREVFGQAELGAGFDFRPNINVLPISTFISVDIPKNFKLPDSIYRLDDDAFRYARLPEGFKFDLSKHAIAVETGIVDVRLPRGCDWFDADGRRTRNLDFAKEFLEVRKI